MLSVQVPCDPSLSISPWVVLSPSIPADQTFHSEFLDAVYKSPSPAAPATVRTNSLISVVDSLSQSSNKTKESIEFLPLLQSQSQAVEIQHAEQPAEPFGAVTAKGIVSRIEKICIFKSPYMVVKA